MTRVLDVLLAVVAPPSCTACRAPLRAPGAVLCRRCRDALPWLPDAVCPRCGLPAPCGRRCPAAGASFDVAWAPLAHAGPARALVHAHKHRGRRAACGLMAAQIAATAPDRLLPAGAVLVPVPADPRRRRRRGFDHAGDLACAVGARTARPVSAVLRVPRGAPQAGRDRADRRRAAEDRRLTVAGAPPARAVLVDDVHTTGATLDACARALRAAGTGWVGAVTYTRALP